MNPVMLFDKPATEQAEADVIARSVAEAVPGIRALAFYDARDDIAKFRVDFCGDAPPGKVTRVVEEMAKHGATYFDPYAIDPRHQDDSIDNDIEER